jgi:hypothetical protein
MAKKKSNKKTTSKTKGKNVAILPKKSTGSFISLIDEKSASERQLIIKFWQSLNNESRKKIIRIDRNELLKKIKEKYRHICSCSVCGRKRAVIDKEVERLYHDYCEELQSRTSGTKYPFCPNHRHQIENHSLNLKDRKLAKESMAVDLDISSQSAAGFTTIQQKQLDHLQNKEKHLKIKHQQREKELLQQLKQNLQEVEKASSNDTAKSGTSASNDQTPAIALAEVPYQASVEEIQSELNVKQVSSNKIDSVHGEIDDEGASNESNTSDSIPSMIEEVSDDISEITQNSSDNIDDFTSDEYLCWNFGRNLIIQNNAITITDSWMLEHADNVIDLFNRFEKSDSGSLDRLEKILGSSGNHRSFRKSTSSGTSIRTSKPTTGAGVTTTELSNGTITTSKTMSRNGSTTCTETTTKVNNGTTTITTTTIEENIDEEYSDEEEDDDDEDDEYSNEEEDDGSEEEEEEEESDEDTELSKWRESKKMFRMYAAKLFYEKIVMAFREKLAIEMQNALIDEEEQREKERQKKEKKQKESQLKKKKREEEREQKRKEKELQEQKEKEKKLLEQKEKERKRIENERKRIEQEMIALAKKQLEESRQQEEIERQIAKEREQREREQREIEERRIREEKEQEREQLEAQIREQQKKNKKQKKKPATKAETLRHPPAMQQPAITQRKSSMQELRPPSPPQLDDSSLEEFYLKIQDVRITPKNTVAEAAPSQFEVLQEHNIFREGVRIPERKLINKGPNPVLEDRAIEKPQRRLSSPPGLLEPSMHNAQEAVPITASFNSPFAWGAPANPSPNVGSRFLPPQQTPFSSQGPTHPLFGPNVFSQQQQDTAPGAMFNAFSSNPWTNDLFQPQQPHQLPQVDHSFNNWTPQQPQTSQEYNAFYNSFTSFNTQQPAPRAPNAFLPNQQQPQQQQQPAQSTFNPMNAFINPGWSKWN